MNGQGGVVEVSVAAATATVDYDLLRNTKYKQSQMARRLRGVALKGSAAAGDTKVAAYVGTDEKGTVYNTGTGFPDRDDVKPIDVIVPAGAELAVYVTDAPSTNPINLMLLFA